MKYKFTYPGVKEIAINVYNMWQLKKFNYLEFPDIAYEALNKQIDLNEFCPIKISRWMQSLSIPEQLQDESKNLFGDPPITLHSDELFVIDIYFWTSRNTTLHDHAFSGAFCVLQGEIFQICYKFDKYDFYKDDSLSIGYLRPLSISILSNHNQIVKITPGNMFIHSTTHLTYPTLTLCIRTKQTPNFNQCNYLYPTLALKPSISSFPDIYVETYKTLKIINLNEANKYFDFLISAPRLRILIKLVFYLINNGDYGLLNYILEKLQKLDTVIFEAINELIYNISFCQKNIKEYNACQKDSIILCELLKLNLSVGNILFLIKRAFPQKNEYDILFKWLTIGGQENVASNSIILKMLKSCNQLSKNNSISNQEKLYAK